MALTVSTLSSSDIDRVDELMKKNSQTLGFLPRAALAEHLNHRTVLGAKTPDGHLAAYLLYASYRERFRIVHLCVSEHFRERSLAKELFEALKAKRTTQCVIRLNCRRDYDAHRIWPRLGFIPVDEKPGRSLDRHPLTCWEYRVAADQQLDIFREKTSDQALDVVIDAHILFHFNAPSSPESNPSQALKSDFLADLIHISLTDEIFLEIDRQRDPKIRRESLALAHLYAPVNHDQASAENYESKLRLLLNPHSKSDVSDVKHLAKTAASDVNTFVTQDNRILSLRDKISSLTRLEVVSPVELVVRLHEQIAKESYRSSPISGQELAWHRARSNDSTKLVEDLLRPGESKRKLRRVLHQFLSRPEFCTFEVLTRDQQILGGRASTKDSDYVTISFVRAANSNDQRLIERFLVSDILATCVEEDLHAIQIKGDGLPDDMDKYLLEMGFHREGANYGRLCLAGPLTRDEVNDEAHRLFPASSWSNLTDHEILTRCSPVALKDGEEKCFIVPIKPAYAMSLFDKQSAGNDLFGGESQILMRWENAYYRKKSHHLILKAPARVLWYESGDVGAITASSHLQSVKIGSPKDLYRRFQKFGTLNWAEIYGMCDGDPQREIMVLEFSHTFAFRHRITLDALRAIEKRHQVPLQSPRSINNGEFLKIMEMGFMEVST